MDGSPPVLGGLPLEALRPFLPPGVRAEQPEAWLDSPNVLDGLRERLAAGRDQARARASRRGRRRNKLNS